ncbi:MAG TPA: polyprenyl diphosphate synthase [Candidatus Saccharimonadales bacterium]|nr:polyprenyl diphosphate synthase [Candidatus Saccharimonadales bacterium]
METSTLKVVPEHIGFIVDGNRRWAKKHGLPGYEGHLAGHAALKEVLRTAVQRGIKYVSFYVFSSENWKRSQDEVSHIMNMAVRLIKDDVKELLKENTRLVVIGKRQGLPDKVAQAFDDAEAKTAHCSRATALFCFNYGGQQEIADAASQCAQDGVPITPESIRERLYYPQAPDIDLVVRTSGEQRLSNFMLWRTSYSEFLFLDTLWPDLRPADVDVMLEEYNKRQRRFGGS